MSALRGPPHPLLPGYVGVGDLVQAALRSRGSNRHFGAVSLAIVDERAGIIRQVDEGRRSSTLAWRWWIETRRRSYTQRPTPDCRL
jgi:hypothetical protein